MENLPFQFHFYCNFFLNYKNSARLVFFDGRIIILLCNPAARSSRVLDVRDSRKHFLFDSKLSILKIFTHFFYKRKRKFLLFDNLQSTLHCRVLYPWGAFARQRCLSPSCRRVFFCEIFEQDGFLFREIFVKKANCK